MDLEGIMLSNSNRERQILFVLFYPESETMPPSNQARSTLNRLVVAVGEGWGVRKMENFLA